MESKHSSGDFHIIVRDPATNNVCDDRHFTSRLLARKCYKAVAAKNPNKDVYFWRVTRYLLEASFAKKPNMKGVANE